MSTAVVVSDVNSLFNALRNRLVNSPLPISNLAAIVQRSIDDNFRAKGRYDGSNSTILSGGTSKWVQLAPSTKAAYAKKGWSTDRTLARTGGGLASAITVRGVGRHIIISAMKPYAQAQQEGATIRRIINITKRMRKFFWAKFYETQDAKFRAMALTKKTQFSQTIIIPPAPYLVLQQQDLADMQELILEMYK